MLTLAGRTFASAVVSPPRRAMGCIGAPLSGVSLWVTLTVESRPDSVSALWAGLDTPFDVLADPWPIVMRSDAPCGLADSCVAT